MQKQYKLYIFDKNGLDITIEKLNEMIDRSRVVSITDVMAAIEYDYTNNTYKELLESMSKLNASQYIVTTSKFYQILERLVNKNVIIYEIKLHLLFEEDNQAICDYVKCINSDKDKANNIKLLLNELKWYNYGEGIDISYISFGLSNSIDGRNSRFYIYNNGIVAIDSDTMRDEIFQMLKDII